MFNDILINFGLNASDYQVQPFGSGLINHTYKVSGVNHSYILQQINNSVFKDPDAIDNNLTLIKDYLDKNSPDYLFVAPIRGKTGKSIIQSADGNFYRLFPFIEGSHTVNFLQADKEAFNAALQFGRFTRLLNNFDISKLSYTLPDFHNLKLRFEQFKQAATDTATDKLEEASAEIREAYNNANIAHTYTQIVQNSEIPLRVIHHDTKINNVLFDDKHNALCLVDLDTVMPGYYLSDVGDMMRTYLSAANEEEKEFDKITIRQEFFKAIYAGYMAEMGGILTEAEKQLFIFSGEMMIYMQGLRFLTDFLNNDIYYGARYKGHNLVRAKNQFRLLSEYQKAIPDFCLLIARVDKELLNPAE
ncbi:phosphotransferase enzyme family protein [Mucilaginibacter celer]|uniref:Aminoglycoside phosphotransferase family protein n=1 Tax=Mucilaginibacter celer TaxID=2305508 RepID=A0A494VNB9_9SPHI|nr:aminoglycoside phosphotransferase family protein [Mucilaginibacter celer]AYL95659.1 aminoglycoside phosphotransferase family protein [Mucilaginibacter celer]